MRPPLSKAPLFGLLCGFLAGVLFVYATGLEAPILWWAFSIATIVCGALLIIFKKSYVGICVMMGAVGACCAKISIPPSPPVEAVTPYPAQFSGMIETVSLQASSQHAKVKIIEFDGQNIRPFYCLLTIADIEPTFQPGEIIRFSCAMKSVEQISEIKGLNAGKTYYLSRGISATGFVSAENIVVLEQLHGIRFLPYRLQQRLADAVVASPLSEKAQDFFLASVLGMRGEINHSIRRDFAKVGVAHLLCVSGYHVGLVAWLVTVALFPLRGTPKKLRQMRHFVAIALIWLYVLIVGAQPPAMRAAIMITLYLLSLISQRGRFPFNSLCAAALILLAFNPFQLFDAGFQMSFCAVLGILLFASALNPVNRRHRALFHLAEWVCLPVSAVLGTLPVVVYTFHALPLAFLPSNMFVAVFFPLFLGLSGIAIILWHIGLRLALIAVPANRLIDLFYDIFSYAKLGEYTLNDINPSLLGIVCLCAALACLAIFLRVKGKKLKSTFGLLSLLGVILFVNMPERGGNDSSLVFGIRGNKFVTLVHTDNLGMVIASDSLTRYNPEFQDFLRMRGAEYINTASKPMEIKSEKLLASSKGLVVKENKTYVYGPTLSTLPADAVIIHRSYQPDIEEIRIRKNGEVFLCTDFSRKKIKEFEERLKAKGIRYRFVREGDYIEF